jgi:hypothetical protein
MMIFEFTYDNLFYGLFHFFKLKHTTMTTTFEVIRHTEDGEDCAFPELKVQCGSVTIVQGLSDNKDILEIVNALEGTQFWAPQKGNGGPSISFVVKPDNQCYFTFQQAVECDYLTITVPLEYDVVMNALKAYK